MLVCLCYAVGDARIRAAAEEGARTIADLGRMTGAGTDCGSCRDRLEQILADVVHDPAVPGDRRR